MNCARCGNPLDADAKVCGQCGAVVGVTYKPATAAPAFAHPVEPTGFAVPAEPADLAAVNAAGAFAPLPHADASLASSVRPLSGATPRGIVARIKGILLTPRSEWPLIADEPASVRAIYLRYVIPLAAIGAIALFIGQVAIGMPVPLIGIVRVGIVIGLVSSVLAFGLAVASVFVLAQVVSMLAPRFGGQSDDMRALKLVAYSYTPAWLAGVLHVAPGIAILGVLASLYGAWLAVLGLPVLMRNKPEQTLAYAATVAACAIGLALVASLMVGVLLSF